MRIDKAKLEIEMARACMNAVDLSEAANMPRTTVNNVVAGREARPATIGKIAKALGIDVMDIIEQ